MDDDRRFTVEEIDFTLSLNRGIQHFQKLDDFLQKSRFGLTALFNDPTQPVSIT